MENVKKYVTTTLDSGCDCGCENDCYYIMVYSDEQYSDEIDSFMLHGNMYEDDNTGENMYRKAYELANVENITTDEEVLKAILVEVELDEREYCFDKDYCDDETWKKEHGEKTRQQGYDESMAWHKTLTLDELLEYYGDKYDYVLDRLGYEIKS